MKYLIKIYEMVLSIFSYLAGNSDQDGLEYQEGENFVSKKDDLLFVDNEYGFSESYVSEGEEKSGHYVSRKSLDVETDGKYGYSKTYVNSDDGIDVESYQEAKPKRIKFKASIIND